MDQNKVNKGIQKILDNKNIFLVVVVVLIFFICAVILFGDFYSKIVNYRDLNRGKLEKIALVDSFNKSKDAVDNFKKSVPKPLSGDELINQIEEYATHNHINVIDVASKDPQNFDNYISTGMNMTVKVKDFKDLVSFFNMVETSPYSLKVEVWSAKSKNAADGSFDCEMYIVASQIKT
jgi:hypothetical protein